MLKCSVTFFTHKANRDNNEDALLIGGEIIQQESMQASISRDLCLSQKNPFFLFAVADGMGGHRKGEIASRIVIETILSMVLEMISIESIQMVMNEAHRCVVGHGLSDPMAYGLGSTIAGVIAHYHEDMRHIGFAFNVGDSRVYRRSGSYLQQLSQDQTVVQELVDEGLITENDGRHHPQAGHLTECIGGLMDTQRQLSVNVRQIALNPKDSFLICTDGLTDMLSIDQMEAILNQSSDDQHKAIDLYRQAMEAGGKDNVSFMIVKCC